jgi:histidine triad (HIT) family protein
MSTVFTKIIQREIPSEIVWEDEEFIAIMDVNPIRTGHVLLIPKLEVDSIFDLPDPLYCNIWTTARKLQAPLAKATSSPRVGIAVEGFGVAHAHIHLVPVYQGNDLSPERAKPMTQAELKAIGQTIREAINNAGL